MQIRIIGHPSVHDDKGEPVRVSQQMTHAVSALTIAATGDASGRGRLSVDTLQLMLWDDADFHDHKGALKSLLSKLRKLLGDDRLPTAGSDHGLRLDVRPTDYVDLRVFRSRVVRADDARRRGDLEVAAEILRRAVTMWEDLRLMALPDTLAMASVRGNLLMELQSARQSYADVRLLLGHHQQVAREIAEWMKSDPLNEVLVGQHMTALHRSGRKADALLVYEEFRETIRKATRSRDYHGTEPGPDLQRIRDKIDQNDPGLDWEPLPMRPNDAAVLAAGADPRTPLHSRILNHQLGGDHHLWVDRAVVEDMRAIAANMNDVPLENEEFFARAVEHVASLGIRQFIEFGTGMPSPKSPHVVARKTAAGGGGPAAIPVLYVTSDPTVVQFAVASGSLIDDHTGIIYSRMRNPSETLDSDEAKALLDFDRPVGVIFRDALNYLPDHYAPAAFIARIMEAVPAGSVLILSNGTTEGISEAVEEQLRILYQDAAQPLIVRTREQITAMFDRLRFVDPEAAEPGVVRVDTWGTRLLARMELPMIALGGVAIKD